MGAFKLGKMTFGSLFKKPETLQYPFQTKQPPQGLKGQIGIDVQACILCGMCERSCTTGCLSVSKTDHYWQINRYQCVQCGYCISVCPKKCLFMLPSYAAVAPAMATERLAVPEQEGKGDKKAADRAKVQKSEDAHKDVPACQTQPQQTPTTPAQNAAIAKADDMVTLEDHQVEDLISLMDQERGSKARDALRQLDRLP